MKKVLALTMFLFSLSQFALAISGPSTPSSGGGTGMPRCAFYDTGWEEHGFHNSCQECNDKHHGSCLQKCYSYSYTCTASGTDSAGAKQTAKAFGRDEFYTRNDALNHCYAQGLKNCSVDSCSEDSQLISSKSCQ